MPATGNKIQKEKLIRANLKLKEILKDPSLKDLKEDELRLEVERRIKQAGLAEYILIMPREKDPHLRIYRPNRKLPKRKRPWGRS